MARACLPLVGPIALFLALSAGAAHAQAQSSQDDACSAGISCDCANISGAGINTIPYRTDCRICESRIVDECRRRYAVNGDAVQSIADAVNKVGFCTTLCSKHGPDPFPVDSGRRPQESEREAKLPEKAKPMRLLCGLKRQLSHEDAGGIESTGCVGKNGKREGLWIQRDTRRNVVIEVFYRDGRQVWRRERKMA